MSEAIDPSESQNSEGPELSTADDRLWATAYHEAGHAVMALLLGRPIQKVTIAPARTQVGGLRLGVCELQKSRTKATRDWLEDEVMILLAGMVGESLWTGVTCRDGAAQDLMAVRRLLSRDRANNERQLERLESRMLDKTEHLLSDDEAAQAIAWVARDLVEKTSISGRTVRHWVEQAYKQPKRK